jgi:hypothetical protein
VCTAHASVRASLAACVQFGVIALFLLVPSFAWADDDKAPQTVDAPVARDPASNLRRPQDESTPGPLKLQKRFSSDMTLVGGQPTDNGSAPSGPREIVEFQKRMEELQKAQQQFASEYQKAMKDLQESLPRTVQMDIKRQEVKQKLDAAQAEMAAMSIAQGQGMGSPMPDNAALVAFPLKYVRPQEIAQALHDITGGGERIAVDERNNTLLIAGSPKQMDVAKQIVQTLDQPGKSQQGKTPEVLQLRIVWLSEGMTDRNMEPPKASVVSPQVADALRELGMEQPQVVCQELTSLTISPADLHGKYRFRVPTQIEDSTWEFQGEGTITPTADDRYDMDFNLSLSEPVSKNPLSSQLSGSILTPLGHYTVMGTTTFVAPSKEATVGKVQRLSAFVVYLDRPKDFGETESSGTSSKKSGNKSQ